jgi:hypothetical protein
MRTDPLTLRCSATLEAGERSEHDGQRARVAIVGGGPHALTIAAQLVAADRSLADDLVVLDPSGTWLSAWRRSFAVLEIEHLRSPVVHHPHPEPYGLLDFARRHRRTDELHGRYQAPGTRLFSDYCDTVIDHFGLADAVTAATVTRVTTDGTIMFETQGTDHHPHDHDNDHHGTARSLTADVVVLAQHPRRAVMPDVGAPGPITPLHAGAVDLDRVRPGQHVTIVGGGLTAGHLVCGAARRGARVDLVARRPLVEREFDTDPGWLGPKEMRGFLAIECLTERATCAAAARGGGSVPAWMLGQLRELEAAGRLCITCLDTGAHTGAHVEGHTTRTTLGAELADIRRQRGGTDHLWWATGWAVDVAADPLLGPLIDSTGSETVAGFLVLGRRLELPGSAVHVVGRPATLRLGPTAGNLAGARRAAALISGDDPDLL